MIRPARLLTFCLLAVAATAVYGDNTEPPRKPVWERIAVGKDANNTYSPDPERPDVSVLRGVVYISVPDPVDAQVFTILGQPVARTRLQPGVTTLRLPTRGMYILRIGDLTRRISI